MIFFMLLVLLNCCNHFLIFLSLFAFHLILPSITPLGLVSQTPMAAAKTRPSSATAGGPAPSKRPTSSNTTSISDKKMTTAKASSISTTGPKQASLTPSGPAPTATRDLKSKVRFCCYAEVMIESPPEFGNPQHNIKGNASNAPSAPNSNYISSFITDRNHLCSEVKVGRQWTLYLLPLSQRCAGVKVSVFPILFTLRMSKID